MLAGRNATECCTCKRKARAIPTFFQYLILIILTICFIIPGVIYFLFAKPKDCFICGLKMNKEY